MIGAPWCEGQNLEGTDLAPTAMREAGLPEAVQRLGMEWLDAGDIDFAGHFKSLGISAAVKHLDSVVLYREWLSENSTDNFSTWQTKKRHASEVRTPSPNGAPLRQKLAHGSEAYPVDSAADAKGEVNVVNAEVMGAGLKLVHDAVVSACLKKAFVLTVGGDHSIAAATICAMTKTHPDLGVIWVDAHADANTPRTSPSGHYHGMPAAHCLGWFDQPGEAGEGLSASDLKGFEWFTSGCLPENKLAYIGLRDVDPEEGRMLRRSGVRRRLGGAHGGLRRAPHSRRRAPPPLNPFPAHARPPRRRR